MNKFILTSCMYLCTIAFQSSAYAQQIDPKNQPDPITVYFKSPNYGNIAVGIASTILCIKIRSLSATDPIDQYMNDIFARMCIVVAGISGAAELLMYWNKDKPCTIISNDGIYLKYLNNTTISWNDITNIREVHGIINKAFYIDTTSYGSLCLVKTSFPRLLTASYDEIVETTKSFFQLSRKKELS